MASNAAARTLEHRWYQSPGRWKLCLPDSCGTAVADWGADALTYALALRWRLTRDGAAVPILDDIMVAAPLYGTCRHGGCSLWSDVPLWDAVAAARIFQTTGNPRALFKARRAFALVDASDAFALGACPAIRFQQPQGGSTALKTLETDSNYIKAALLLARLTGEPRFLDKARATYAAVRRYFLDPHRALYSVYVFDDGSTCRQVPRRFFASVNGNMIDNGLSLADATGHAGYAADALATARAVAGELSDPAGVFADLQAENDIAEPLVEAMYRVATQRRAPFARRWLLAAARVAQPAATGAYGRFFDGPAPAGPISAWQSSGGLALAFVAGALDPSGTPAAPDVWARARFVADPIDALPARISFDGRAIALIGTIGDVCCEAGHARVFIDGRETVDRTGIWQNKSSSGRRLPHSVLLSWRWPQRGAHTIELGPGVANAKEGGAFIHLDGYELVL
jgi:hypothetical protein